MPNLHTYKRPPKELSKDEQQRLLSVSGEKPSTWRDHLIISLALGTGMREHEIMALDWPQLIARNGHTMREIVEIDVFKDDERIGGTQPVFLPPDCRRKLLLYWQRLDCPRLGPVFISKKGNRLALRSVRDLFAKWQRIAELDRHYTFHSLRHTFTRAVLDEGKDLTVAQKAARHRRISTTIKYTEPGDERVAKVIRRLHA